MKNVPYYDHRTGEITQIPAAELAPGLMLSTITDADGTPHEVFLDGYEMMKEALRDGRVRTVENVMAPERNDGRWKRMCRFVSESLWELLPMQPDEWDADFRGEEDPEASAVHFVRLAKAYKVLTVGHDLSRCMKLEILDLLQKALDCGILALQTTKLEWLSKDEATMIVETVEAVTGEIE